MRKIDLILENIRDEYMINLLEEGTASELETLKTKKFLNENLNRIRKMLIEEGTLDGVKEHLGDNWGKYLAGAGAGAMANGMNNAGVSAGDVVGGMGAAMNADPGAAAGYAAGVPANLATNGAIDAAGQAGGAISDAVGQAGDYISQQMAPPTAGEQVSQFVQDAAGNILDGAGNIVGNIADFAKDAVS